MIPTPIQTPESESESLFDCDSVVGIAPCLYTMKVITFWFFIHMDNPEI